MEVFKAIDIGPVRDNQEDALLDKEWKQTENKERSGRLFVVSDGMGGHAGGELASKAVIDAFDGLDQDNFAGAINNSLDEMHDAIILANINCLKAKDKRGATCTAIYLPKHAEDHCLYVHVGDSRLYHISGKHIKQITEDHGLGHVLYNCVGSEKMYIDKDVFKVKVGDALVLCSDGVSDVLSILDVAKIACESKGPARGLIRRAIAEETTDNCTAIVIRL